MKPTTKATKVSSEPPKTTSTNKVQTIEASSAPTPKSAPISTAPTTIPTVNGIVSNTGKEKKKKKSEFNTLQQLGIISQ